MRLNSSSQLNSNAYLNYEPVVEPVVVEPFATHVTRGRQRGATVKSGTYAAKVRSTGRTQSVRTQKPL